MKSNTHDIYVYTHIKDDVSILFDTFAEDDNR